jgi:hypothetical protein
MGDGGRCPVCRTMLSMRVDGPDGRWCNRCGHIEPVEEYVPAVHKSNRINREKPGKVKQVSDRRVPKFPSKSKGKK